MVQIIYRIYIIKAAVYAVHGIYLVCLFKAGDVLWLAYMMYTIYIVYIFNAGDVLWLLYMVHIGYI